MMRPHPSRMQVLYGVVMAFIRSDMDKFTPEGESETIDLEICKFTGTRLVCSSGPWLPLQNANCYCECCTSEENRSACVSSAEGLRQPAVSPTVVLERMQKQCLISSYVIVDVQAENASVNSVKPEGKGLQRKEGSDYMELKGEHDLDLKTHSTKIHILNAYATLKTRTFYIVEASDRRLSGILDHLLYVYMLRWKNTLANVNDKAKKVTENTDNTPFEDSLGDVVTSTTLSTHLIAPTFAGTPETTTPLQLTRGTSRSLKTLTSIPTSATPFSVKTSLQVTETKEPKQKNTCSQTPASPESTRNEEFKNPGEAIKQSNKEIKRTLMISRATDEDLKTFVHDYFDYHVLDNESPTSASLVIADFARVHTSPSNHQKRSCQQTLLILSAVEEETFLQGANVNTVKNTSLIHNKVTTSAFSTTEDSEHAGTSASTHRKRARENIQAVSVACEDASSKRI
ncbi:hypothetical protein Tco_1438582 [Tanacetum coccineum]